jgi:hypothetical protein
MKIVHQRAMEAIVRRRFIVLHGVPSLRGKIRHDNQAPVKPARRSPLPI